MTNALGLSKSDYQGLKSTLCVGCGHDSITNHLITAIFQSNIPPTSIAKLSGIGCSSKTPAYFLNQAHGFNAIHGRMAPVATGVHLANSELKLIGISGDGDSASIGLGSFLHLLRRNVPMLYIVENNGVYGLTKGQFSATADKDSSLKSGEINPFQTMDLCALAIEAGCPFVARSFSGDAKQLTALFAAALRFEGTAFIDVISPCVTFANHEGSTKSFHFVKNHRRHLQELGFIEAQDDLVAEQKIEKLELQLHDGSILRLQPIEGLEHDVTSGLSALTHLRQTRSSGDILTGLIYLDTHKATLKESIKLTSQALIRSDLPLKPSQEHLSEAMKDFC